MAAADPTDLSVAMLWNFKVALRERGVINRDTGRVTDVAGFALALVGTLKKPIVVPCGEDVDAALARGQDPVTHVRVHVVRAPGVRRACFRAGRAAAAPGEQIVSYIVTSRDGAPHIDGVPPLDAAEAARVWQLLAADAAAVELFEDEPPVLAAWLRERIDPHGDG